jgi:hypothetical protein
MTTPNSNPPWYHLTPARFFIGLLAVQVLLLLADRFDWFPFNERKGWTVLIGVGVVCVAVLVMLFWGAFAWFFGGDFSSLSGRCWYFWWR